MKTAAKMVVEILEGPPGCGKSTKMRAEAEAQGGRFLFAYPTAKLLSEQAKAFTTSGRLKVVEAHSKSKGSGTVQQRLTEAARQVTEGGINDAVVLTTHESFMGCDLRDFSGWHFRVDEAPNAAQSRKLSVPVSRDLFKAKYGIQPHSIDGWYEVNLINSADRWTDVARDDLAKPVAEFMKHAARPAGVLVDVPNWDIQSFRWCALWSPDFLQGIPASFAIAGASYAHSIGAFVARDKITMKTRVLPMVRSKTPNINIHYFTRAHKGSTQLWKRSEGRFMIMKVCDYLHAHVKDLGFWSANDVVKDLMEHRLAGEMISAKSMGLNEYDKLTSCAFIFSSSATPDDEPLKILTGISDAQIERAREEEDILQFVMRGAVRDRTFGGDYDVYLYTKKQADDLAAKLTASKVGAVTVIPATAAGILNDTGKRRKAPSANLAKKQTQRVWSARSGKYISAASDARAKKRGNSTTPKGPVGRPRKSGPGR